MIMGQQLVVYGKAAKVNFVLRPINYGKTPLHTLTLSLKVGNDYCTDGSAVWNHRTIEVPAPTSDGEISIPLSVDNRGWQQGDVLQLEVHAANGEQNGTSFPFATKEIFFFSAPVPRKVVMEDYTGTWCPNCPFAMATMQALNRLHPDDFVGISIHDRDGMACRDFSVRYNSWRFPGRPFLHLNRSKNGKTPPLTGSGTSGGDRFGSNADFLREKNMPVEAEIRVRAGWDAAHSTISVASSTIFRAIFPERKYAVAYVVTANGLKSNSLFQRNDPYGYRKFRGIVPEMDFFLDQGTSVGGIAFDDVAVSGLGIDGGIDGSLPVSLELDKGYEHRAEIVDPIRIAAKALVNPAEVYVCALLLNTATGEVVNADKCKVGNGMPEMPSYAPLLPETPPQPEPPKEEPKPVIPPTEPEHPQPPKVVYVDSVRIHPAALTVHVGDVFQLEAMVYPESTDFAVVRWWCDAPMLLHVLGNGAFKAVAVGDALVCAQSTDGQKHEARCSVHIIQPDGIASAAATSAFAVQREGEHLQLSQLPPAALVEVYTLGGQLLHRGTALLGTYHLRVPKTGCLLLRINHTWHKMVP